MVSFFNPVLWAGFFIFCTRLQYFYKTVLLYCLYMAVKVLITVTQWIW